MNKYKYLTKEYVIYLFLVLSNIIFTNCTKKNYEALPNDKTLNQTMYQEEEIIVDKPDIDKLAYELYLLVMCHSVKNVNKFVQDHKSVLPAIFSKRRKGYTPLQHAIIQNYFPIVVALLYGLPAEHRKAELLKKSDNGCNTLEVAIKEQNPNIVNILLNSLSIQERIEAIMTEDEEGHTLLTTAVCENQGENKVQIMNALLAPLTLAQKRTLIMPSKKCKTFVTHIAIRRGNLDMFEILWDLLTPEDQQYLFKVQEPYTGDRLLHLMVCRFTSGEALLKNCLQVMPNEDIPALLMMQNSFRNTVLHTAARRRKTQIVLYFLNFIHEWFKSGLGYSIPILNLRNMYGETPIESCVKNDYTTINIFKEMQSKISKDLLVYAFVHKLLPIRRSSGFCCTVKKRVLELLE